MSDIALLVSDPARTAAQFHELFGADAVRREDENGHVETFVRLAGIWIVLVGEPVERARAAVILRFTPRWTLSSPPSLNCGPWGVSSSGRAPPELCISSMTMITYSNWILRTLMRSLDEGRRAASQMPSTGQVRSRATAVDSAARSRAAEALKVLKLCAAPPARQEAINTCYGVLFRLGVLRRLGA